MTTSIILLRFKCLFFHWLKYLCLCVVEFCVSRIILSFVRCLMIVLMLLASVYNNCNGEWLAIVNIYIIMQGECCPVWVLYCNRFAG